MGYYVELKDCNAYIAPEDYEEAYTLLCALNDNNRLKGGGSSASMCGCEYGNHTCQGAHDGVWFSWMHWNYPETCHSAQEVLEQVGFVTDTHSYGGHYGLHVIAYDSKTGDEQHFVSALAHLWRSIDSDEPYFQWMGEDGYQYMWAMQSGTLVELAAVTTWVVR